VSATGLATALAWLAILLLPVAPLRAVDRLPQLTGDIRIHDPPIIDVDGQYTAFGTGERGPLSRRDPGQDVARRE
jgi:arabinan endo-1,5-alpha-L-arabinosidase